MVAVITVIIVALFVFVTLARTSASSRRPAPRRRALRPLFAHALARAHARRPLRRPNAAAIDLREQVVSFPPQPVITEDNLVVSIDTVIYFQVTDAKAATYEIANYIQAIEQLTVTTLRNVIGGLALEKTLTSRDEINASCAASSTTRPANGASASTASS